MDAERAKFAKEKEYEDLLNRIGMELEVKSASELSLLDHNKVLKIWRKRLMKRQLLKRRRLRKSEPLLRRSELVQ